VARYLVAAGMAEDPEQGYAFAQAAKRLAARVGVVREACGIAAYQTGRWADALSEFRAARRMTGQNDYVPVMADCERALGRPDRALALVREVNAADLSRPTQIELRIVESGIRRDQGLADAAVLVLQVPELTSGRVRPWSVRLFYAYGDALLAADRAEEARAAFARAVELDPDGETDAAERLDELDGIVIDDLEDDEFQDDLEDDDDLDDSESEDSASEDSELDAELEDAELEDAELEDDPQDDDPEDDAVEKQLEDEAEVAEPEDESEKAESEDEPQDKQDSALEKN
jgi:tetratricopeptide (TPR) repeat protein